LEAGSTMSSEETDAADKPLRQYIDELHMQLNEAEEILRAIAEYKVDAFVMGQADAKQVYTLKGSDHAYQVILETMNEGAATVGLDSTVLYCNPAFSKLLQLPVNQVVGTSLVRFVNSEDLPLYNSLIEQGAIQRSRGEVRLKTASGTPVSVLLSCGSFILDSLQCICLVATDLTEQKHQAELVEAGLLARSILEQANAAMVVCDVEGQIILANRRAHQLCGCNPMLRRFEQAFPLHQKSNDPAGSIVPLTLLNDLHGRMVQNQEVILLPESGGPYYLLLSSAVLLDSEKQSLGNVITLVDITAHKQMEESLRQARDELEQRVNERTAELLEINRHLQREIEERKQTEVALTEVRQRLSQIREMERLLLARELHDGPLQEVIGMAFDLLLLTQMLEKEEQIAKATEISNAVQKTARHLRLVAQTLRPPVLAHLGLTAAVRAHIKQVQESREAPAISFAASEEVWSVPEETALALLRIMQQAVQNALQHANASHIEVRLHYDENRLCLEVQDDGRGLSKPYHRVEFARDGHLGIVGMAERAEAIRGAFEVESRAGEGTCIRVTIPKILEKDKKEIEE
jgi:PAS domain S-box-containing protein